MTGSAPSEPSERPRRRRVLHGRRVGRPLRPARRKLLDELLPRLAVPVPSSGDASAPVAGALDPRALFAGPPVFGQEHTSTPPPAGLWLEVGFGAGEHLAAQAAAHPETGLIGCEPFLNGVAALLARVADDRLENIRIHADDARAVIDRLPDACLDRVFVLFPDPWPKARHAKRRFVSRANLEALARAMADGAELRVASDQMFYIRWSLSEVLSCPDFEWMAETPSDWRTRPADQPATRYEQKARARGLDPVFLRFRRRPRTVGKCQIT